MKRATLIIDVALLLSGCALSAADSPDTDLARALANPELRSRAVKSVVAAGPSKLGVLLYWTYVPPPGVNTGELDLGLAEVFGELRAEEAIPFLIANISAERGPLIRPDVFATSPETTERTLPCAAALIRIGPKASAALIERFWDLPASDWPAAIFTVSRIASTKADPTPELSLLRGVEAVLKSEESLVKRALGSEKKQPQAP